MERFIPKKINTILTMFRKEWKRQRELERREEAIAQDYFQRWIVLGEMTTEQLIADEDSKKDERRREGIDTDRIDRLVKDQLSEYYQEQSQQLDEIALVPGTPVKYYYEKEESFSDLGVLVVEPDEDGYAKVDALGGHAKGVHLHQDQIIPVGVDPEVEVGDYACVKMRLSMTFLKRPIWGSVRSRKGDILTVEPLESAHPASSHQEVTVSIHDLKAAVKLRDRFKPPESEL